MTAEEERPARVFKEMIEEGAKFPEFDLEDQNGNRITLHSLKGEKAVIYFYPKDDTSGCTAEACSFRDRLPEIKGARVLGVSPDDVKSHQKFANKFNLNFSLLADLGHKLTEACGLWVEKSLYGRKYMGVERSTFLIDESGVVKKVWRKVKPQDHAAEVAAAVNQ